MPTTFAHNLYGRRVYNGLKPEIRRVIRKNKEFYYLGLYGPDLLFFYRPLKVNAVSGKGLWMHEHEAYGFFERSARKIRQAGEADRDAMTAYLLGFACHFALDSECHGWINRMDKESPFTHAQMETELDRRLLVREGKKPLHTDLTCHLHDTREVRRIVGRILEERERVISSAIWTLRFVSHLFVNTNEKTKEAILTTLFVRGKYASIHGMVMQKEPVPRIDPMVDRLERKFVMAVPVGERLATAVWERIVNGAPLPKRFRKNYE